jgi:hypothetical protein
MQLLTPTCVLLPCRFAFTELMTDMKQPSEFPKAINVCTVIMSALYAGLASAGYWSKGHDVADIVIFSLGESPLARVAAGCILIQVGMTQLL